MTATFSGALSSQGVRWIGLGWGSFIGENLLLSSTRETLVYELGSETNYKTLYGTCVQPNTRWRPTTHRARARAL